MSPSTSQVRRTSPRETVTRRVITTRTATTTTTSHDGFAVESPVPKELLRVLFADVPLVLLFALLVSLSVLEHIHNAYLYPLSRTMVTNANVTKHEKTYYEFVCNESDITAFESEPLILDSKYMTTNQAVDNVLRHGMGIFSNLIDKEDASALRQYVQWRNYQLTNDEKIQILSWQHRYSFGLGANEHESVPPVLQSISTHPLLKPTLEALLGLNPALVELSTITSEVGASAQFLHSDTDVGASALQFGRSYVSLYTILIPLQDTNKDMGSTTICPGSHRCANTPACLDHAFQVNTSNEGVWKAGDGLMYNSDALHRGSAHVDGPDRVVLVVSFASRPDYPTAPLSRFSRKLPFGAKYAIRWDMTGHTLRDLHDPKQYMSQPRATLRGLGVYKPQNEDWGWDSVSMKLTHMVNHRPGYRRESLEMLLRFRVGFLGKIPWLLQGAVSNNDSSMPVFQAYMLGTLHNCWWLVLVLNVAAVGFYVWFMQAADTSSMKSDLGQLFTCALRLGVSYVIVVCVALWVVVGVSRTPWGKDIQSGQITSTPFLSRTNTSEHSLVTPSRSDVLLSDRLLVPKLAAYGSILDHHPGNIQWHEQVSNMALIYFSYKDLPPIFCQAVVDSIMDIVTVDGKHRFLTQNDLGDWIKMTGRDVRDATEERIALEKYKFLANPVIPDQGGPCNACYYTALCAVESPLPKSLLETAVMICPADPAKSMNGPKPSPVFQANSVLPTLQKPGLSYLRDLQLLNQKMMKPGGAAVDLSKRV